jgi:hypothetical protein
MSEPLYKIAHSWRSGGPDRRRRAYQELSADVRLGSKAAHEQGPRLVRYTSMNGHRGVRHIDREARDPARTHHN